MNEFHLRNDAGLALGVLDYGAYVSYLDVPVAGGVRRVTLGCELADYPRQTAYLGSSIGRYGNRIADAVLCRNGRAWPLAANEGPTCLHGGSVGFNDVVWDVLEHGDDFIRLRHVSPDGDQGFPGTLTTTLTYRLDGRDLCIDYDAHADAATPVNLTSHLYFNLDGGDVRDHALRIDADHYLPIDAHLIPLGIAPVDGVFDLRAGRRIGDDWLSHPQQALARGFDHCFCLNGRPDQPAATLRAGDGSLTMELYTDQRGVQLYTGNWLAGTPAPDGKTWGNHAGLCLEAQAFPDAPNREGELGKVWLAPGETYRHRTRYRFIEATPGER